MSSHSANMEATDEPTNVECQEEVIFVEDRRPGNVLTVFNSSKSGVPAFDTPIVEDYIALDTYDAGSSESNSHPDETDGVETSQQVNNKSAAENDTEDSLWVEDRNPLLTGQETQSPRYRISENFLKLQSPASTSPQRNRFANPCFNCEKTDHPLRDCPLPRNHRLINKNRKEYMDSKTTPVYKRYHVDGGMDQFSQVMAPGTVSADLRRALGIEDNELPTFIYMMRRAGYPPGWLQEAVVSHSGISMFDGQGKEVSDQGAIQGEKRKNESKDKYDVRKIVHYPGFNTPPPPDTLDDSDYWRCPPLSRLQSVEVMLERISGQVVGGYKRKKLSHNATGGSSMDDSLQSNESHDMEYEETSENVELPEDNCKFVPPLPEVDLPPPPPLESPESPPAVTESPESPDPEPTSELDTTASAFSLTSDSIEETSIIELEEQKKQLLAQLNDVTPVCGTPESKIGKTKTVEMGTPILQSVSPFARLPASDKFSVNICDVINFENLPDSTGKYEKMSGIIKKVRIVLKEYNNEA